MRKLIAAIFLLAGLGSQPALAQLPCPFIATGKVLTAAQWNSCFSQKADFNGSGFLPLGGGTMIGTLVTAPSTGPQGAGLVVPQGATPTTPVNGALWTTASGLFVQINGSTVGPLASTGSSFAGTPPLSVTTPGGIVTYALNYNASLVLSGGNIGINPANANSYSALQTFASAAVTGPLTLTGSLAATGLVTNADLANSSLTLGATSVSLGGTAGGSSGSPISTLYLSSVNILSAGQITGLPTPTNASDAATKQYVDSSAVGLVVHPSVVLATTAALPANTYNNGSSGVGATLTANSNGNLVIDGTTNPIAGTRLLIKNEVAAANNGIYTVTTTGGASQEYVLTRATDANTPGTGNPSEIGFGSYVLVTSGTVGTNTGWSVNSVVTTIGTSAITWVQFSGGSAISSVSNADGTLTVSPTTGAVVASLNTAHSNAWSAIQVFKGNPNIEIDTASAGQFGYLEFYDAGTTKWQLGKDTTNQFYILDRVAGRNDLQILSNGNLNLMPSTGVVTIGPTGATSYALTIMAPATFGRTLSLEGNISGSDSAVMLFSGLKDGATWQIGGDVLGGATKSFGLFNITNSTLAANWDVNGNLYQYANLSIGGGNPWIDPTSGAHSCNVAPNNGSASSTGPQGSTTTAAAVQCYINWIIANDGYGQLRFPCGTYNLTGGGIDATNGHLPGSPLLQGEALGCVILEVTDNETAVTLGNWGAAQAKPGLDNIFVYCALATPTTPCVVQSGGAVDIKNCTIQGGEWALVNHGSDGTIFNCYIAGVGGIQGTATNCNASTMPSNTTPLTACYGNLYTDGSNWYWRDKFDQNAVQDISTYITTVGTGGVSENTFINSDSSDLVRNSLVVFDNGSQHAIVAWSGYGPLSTPIYIRSADYILITNTNMSGGVSNSSISITNTICGGTITGPGSKNVAGNIGTC